MYLEDTTRSKRSEIEEVVLYSQAPHWWSRKKVLQSREGYLSEVTHLPVTLQQWVRPRGWPGEHKITVLDGLHCLLLTFIHSGYIPSSELLLRRCEAVVHHRVSVRAYRQIEFQGLVSRLPGQLLRVPLRVGGVVQGHQDG